MSYPRSAAFDAALPYSHTPIIKVEVLAAGAVEASTEVLVLGRDLRVIAGAVEQHDRAPVRRSFSLDAVDVDGSILPIATGDLLDPIAGNEVRIWRGIRFDDGTEELLPMGTFGLHVVEVVDQAGGYTLSLSGFDRSKRISEIPWRTPYEIPAGTNIVTAVQGIITDRLTGIGPFVFNFEPTGEVTGDDLVLGGDSTNDPYAEAENLIAAAGQEVFFDPLGTPTGRTVPDLDSAPIAWMYDDHEVGNMLVDPLRRGADRSTLRNGAIVESEAPWLLFPILAEVWDDDPTSPTRRSLIGEHPDKTGSPTIWTQDQADAAALGRFNKTRGIEEQISWSSMSHPGLHGGDVIGVRADLFGEEVVRIATDGLVTPLTIDGTMDGTTRRRRR